MIPRGALRPRKRRRAHTALALVACGDGGPAGGAHACDALAVVRPPERPNLVLVVNDTMRRDRVGAYGGPARTPAFDDFATAHRLFTQASPQAPWTKPSMATLFTGLYPSQHGVLSHPTLEPNRSAPLESDALAGEATTLAEAARAAGYATAAFVANPWMDARFGFAQGFDEYDASQAAFDAPGTDVVRAALAWLANRPRGRPYLLYVHPVDSHAPYPPVARTLLLDRADEIRADARHLTPHARRQILRAVRIEGGVSLSALRLPPTRRALEIAYDGGIETFDRALAMLLAALEREPDHARTAVVVTSDHGESLFDRGWPSHGHGLFEEEIAIRLAARLPGAPSGRQVACGAGLVDLLPTLCEYARLDCPANLPGAVLLHGPGIASAPRRIALRSEGVIGRPRNRAVRDGRYKLLFEPDGRPVRRSTDRPWALFDLLLDPGERRDLMSAMQTEAPVRAAFEGLRSELARSLPAAPAVRRAACGARGRGDGPAPRGARLPRSALTPSERRGRRAFPRGPAENNPEFVT